MSDSLGCCTTRDGGEDAAPKPKDRVLRFEEEEDDEAKVDEDRDRILDGLEEVDSTQRHAKLARFYTVEELDEIEQFVQDFSGTQPVYGRSHTLVGSGHGPWGISTASGGTTNAWTAIDGTNFNVRGPAYLSDRKKVPSGNNLAELAVVDMFMSDDDIANVAACEAAKTVQRLRREGETRKLLILNFRIVPLHFVVVFALPPASTDPDDPSRALLHRFVNDMTDEERNQRLKVIPRLQTGPYPIRKLVGENSPAIIAKKIPVTYYTSENELEISISIAASAVARRVSKTLVRAGSAVDIELVIVIEGKDVSELPEQILGGFRVIHADLSSLRTVENVPEPKEEAQRPSFLPPAN